MFVEYFIIPVELFQYYLSWDHIEVYVLELIPYLSSNILNLGISNTIDSHVPFNPEINVLLAT